MKSNIPLWMQNFLWIVLVIFIVIFLIFAVLGIVAMIKYFLMEDKQNGK